MFRALLVLLAILELLYPRRLVDFWLNLAVAGDDPVELRPWVYTAARVEGVLILVWLFARRKPRG